MSGRQKVLLVEDNADVRRLYAIGLNRHGFSVRLAANGAEAVERIGSERPDILLLDWLMPLMDGREVVDQLERQGVTAIDIIVVSGEPAPPVLPARIRSWLTKPVSVEQLVSEIGRCHEAAPRQPVSAVRPA
jgi:CheY-like chemotaxis protein